MTFYLFFIYILTLGIMAAIAFKMNNEELFWNMLKYSKLLLSLEYFFLIFLAQATLLLFYVIVWIINGLSFAILISYQSINNLFKNNLNLHIQTIQILGQGGFGCVKLVSVPGLPQHAFALKAIRKARIIKTGQQQHILAEKNILLDMRSNFIGRLHRYSFLIDMFCKI